MSGNLNTIVGNNVRKERQKRGLSQEELAELADLHRTYIGMIERAEKNVTISSLEKVASALNIDIRELFAPPDGIGSRGKKQ